MQVYAEGSPVEKALQVIEAVMRAQGITIDFNSGFLEIQLTGHPFHPARVLEMDTKEYMIHPARVLEMDTKEYMTRLPRRYESERLVLE